MTTKKTDEAPARGDLSPAFSTADERLYDKDDDRTISAADAEKRSKAESKAKGAKVDD
jgi:hypothetical protein